MATKKTKKHAKVVRTGVERRSKTDRRSSPPPAPIPISIAAIGLRDLTLRELFDESAPRARAFGSKIPQINLTLDASVDFPAIDAAVLTIHAKVRDVSPEPLIEVELRVTGVFRFKQGLSQRDVGTYLSKMGGGILFPYVRETVHSVSARTLFDAMLVPPTIVTPLFSDEQLASLPDR